MNKIEYSFINAPYDKIRYTEMLNRIFIDEYGYTVHDNENNYSGYHSTLVCKNDGIIIGGISAYIIDQKRIDKLPMQKRGINLKKYIDLKDGRYAEICRAGVLKEYRKHNIYPELMQRCVEFCVKIGCKAGIWVARRYHSEFYKRELEQMGMKVIFLDKIKYIHNIRTGDPITVDYHLSYCYFSD